MGVFVRTAVPKHRRSAPRPDLVALAIDAWLRARALIPLLADLRGPGDHEAVDWRQEEEPLAYQVDVHAMRHLWLTAKAAHDLRAGRRTPLGDGRRVLAELRRTCELLAFLLQGARLTEAGLRLLRARLGRGPEQRQVCLARAAAARRVARLGPSLAAAEAALAAVQARADEAGPEGELCLYGLELPDVWTVGVPSVFLYERPSGENVRWSTIDEWAESFEGALDRRPDGPLKADLRARLEALLLEVEDAGMPWSRVTELEDALFHDDEDEDERSRPDSLDEWHQSVLDRFRQ